MSGPVPVVTSWVTAEAVIRLPFKLGAEPPMSCDSTTFGRMSRRLVQAEAYGDWKQSPGIVLEGIEA